MPNQITKHKAQFKIEELKELFYFNSSVHIPVSISCDSRTINTGEIFLPLRGENFDGHDFINNVLDKGIKHAFCERDKISKVKEEHKSKLILVHDSLDAYHLIASYYRRKINPKVIAVTGSSGKTTVKDLIASVLSTNFKVHKTEANFNNEIGVPKTILEMPENTEYLVLELAMRKRGEIKYLAKTANPDVAVITNIGSAHIGRLGSKSEIIKAKCEILEHLKKDGLAVLCNEPELIQYVEKIWSGKTAVFDSSDVSNVRFKDRVSTFTLSASGIANEVYTVNALGNIHVLNSLLVILIAKYFGLSHGDIQEGLLRFENPQGRGNILKLKEDVFLINESYNANPDSVRAAVDSLVNCWSTDYKKILVLGELAELGEHEDRLLSELWEWLGTKHVDTVITVGDKMKGRSRATFQCSSTAQSAANIPECCAILKELLIPKTVVLIKGSHVASLEKVVEHFHKGPHMVWRAKGNGQTKDKN